MHGPAHRHAFVKPPRAARRPYLATWHGVERTDDYAWLKADNWQQVMQDPAVARPDIRAYLEAENAYAEARWPIPKPLQADALRRDARAHQGGRFRPCRRPTDPLPTASAIVDGRPSSRCSSAAARRRRRSQILLDGNARGRGQGLFPAWAARPQPRPPPARLRLRRQGLRIFTLRIRDLDDRRRPARHRSPAPPAARSCGRTTASRSSTSGSTRTTARRRSTATSSAPTPSDDALVYEETDPGFFLGVGETPVGPLHPDRQPRPRDLRVRI